MRNLDDETATLTSSYKSTRETTYSFVSATQRNMPMLLVTHNKTSGMSLVSATVVGSGEAVPVEAIRDQSSHQGQAIAHRMAVRLPPLSEGPVAVAIRVIEELTETKEEVVDSSCGEYTLEQIERSMKTFSSFGLLTANDANDMQAVIDKTRQMIKLTSLQWIGGVPSSQKDVSALLSKVWIAESEAALLREIVAQREALSAIKENLDAVAKVKNSVETSQDRLRKNITTLSKDGIRENPVLTRYINALGAEEDKYADSVQKEAELQAAKKAAEAEIDTVYLAFKASLDTRLAL